MSDDRNRYRRPAPPMNDDHVRRAAGRKDSRRWCRGKKGVLHSYSWIESRKYGRAAWLQRFGHEGNARPWFDEECSACHKVRRYCTGYFGRCICGNHPAPASA